ncbi:MAG: alanine racemase [Parcubacteria group bacterium]|nr:alanine racemase [Parcubacteria group bacterium]
MTTHFVMSSRLGFRTWIEISKKNLYHNVDQFKSLLKKGTKFGAVIKSNAYGHGLFTIAKLLQNKADWLLVDTFIEGVHLREEGIKNPILVLGYTLPIHFDAAAANNISLSISQFESLKKIVVMEHPPKIHLKFDTGMHRQGFYEHHVAEINSCIGKASFLGGVYTHFASAKDFNYPGYTEKQFKLFQSIIGAFKKSTFPGVLYHAAASGGVIVSPKTHLDMVRVGMGLYGYHPSAEIKDQMVTLAPKKIGLKPILSWKTIVSETKSIEAGEPIGYDLTEYLPKKTNIAILPIGYWHGYDRGLSSVSEVLVRGKRCRVLGRISMDMITVCIGKARVGDEAILLGCGGGEEILADEMARKIGTTSYEVLTRINPLIERIVV